MMLEEVEHLASEQLGSSGIQVEMEEVEKVVTLPPGTWGKAVSRSQSSVAPCCWRLTTMRETQWHYSGTCAGI